MRVKNLKEIQAHKISCHKGGLGLVMKNMNALLALLLALSPLPSRAESISLERFLELALSQNPGLKAESAASEGAEAAASGLAIPSPMAGLMRMSDKSGSSGGFEIEQTLPFPTRLTGDHSARQHESQARSARLRLAKVENQAEARLLYFRLWQTRERINLLREKKAALENHVRLAGASTRSDSFLKVHQLKAESDLDLLENEILQAEQDARERQLEAAELLAEDPATFHPEVRETPPSPLPSESELTKPLSEQAGALDLLAMDSRLTEARSSWLPDLNFRFKKINGTSMNPGYNELMVGLSLPFVYFWGPAAANEKASAGRQEAEARLEQENLKNRTRRIALHERAANLHKQLEQFREKLLPRAEKRMHYVHNLAPRDMETLEDHRESMEFLPELKLKALETRTAYEETLAELAKFKELP
jgi:outer membrane protein, heavy metal efflux system